MYKIYLLVLVFFYSIPFYATSFNILDFGAVAGSRILNTEAIQRTIDACHNGGGGTVIMPAGEYYSGTIFLKSNVCLHLMSGAILQGSYNPHDYPEYNISSHGKFGTVAERENRISTLKSLIIADKAHHIGIKGEGVINGAGEAPVFQLGMNKRGRPKNICFLNSSDVTLNDVSIFNSAEVVVAISGCERVFLKGLYVKSLVNWNNDGLDIDAKDVVVSDCIIEAEDDALCFKSEYVEKACENITVSNCIVSSICNGIKLGTGSRGGFKNIIVTNCVVNRTQEDGFRHWDMPSDIVCSPDLPSVNTGIVIMGVDGGDVENIHFSDIVMNDVLSPFFVRIGKRALNAANRPSAMRNITIRNIVANVRSVIPSVIAGLKESKIEDIHLSNIQIRLTKAVDEEMIKNYPSEVVENIKGYPENRITFGTQITSSAFYVKNVNGICFNEIFVYQPITEVRIPFRFDSVTNVMHTNIFVNNNRYNIKCTD